MGTDLDIFEDDEMLLSSPASKRHNKLHDTLAWKENEFILNFLRRKKKSYAPSYKQSLKSSKILDFIRKTIDIVVQYL